MLYFKSAHRELWETPTVTYSWIIIGWSLHFDVSVTILLTMYSTLSAGRLKLPHTSEIAICALVVYTLYPLTQSILCFNQK